MISGFLILLLLSAGCARKGANRQIDEGKTDGKVYASREIGWEMQIPEGWEVMSRDKLEAQTKKGMNHISEATGTSVDDTGLKYLISFAKDTYNNFQSTSEPFDESDGSWTENTSMIREILYDTYVHQGMRIDTASSVVKIDGLPFDVFKIRIFGLDGKVFMHQDMYSRLINGYSFGVIMNYNNPADREAMEKSLFGSKFRRR